MKTSKKKITRRFSDDELPPQSPLLDDGGGDDDGDETLNDILQQFGPGDSQVKVYRLEDGIESYCHTFTSPQSDYDEAVRKLGYGAGRYRLKIIIGGVFRRSLEMAIAERQTAPGAAPSVDPTIQLLKEQMARQENLIQQLLLRRSDGGGEREPISQVVDAVAKMQGMSGSAMSVETILKCIEIGKGLGGNGGGDDSLTGILKEAIPAVLPALMASRGIPQPFPPNQENPPMRTVSPSTSLPEGQDMNLVEAAMLKGGIAFLKKKCMGGSDPMLYVHLIADNADDAKYQKLLSSVLNEDFSTFVSHDPEIGKEPFEKFFRAIYDGLRSAFSESDSVVNDTGGEGGNNANTESHGGAGAKRGGQ